MLRLNQFIRLTPREISLLAKVTNCTPPTIKTIDELASYVDQAKRRFPMPSTSRRALFWLIDDVVAEILAA
ncbi:hypothetical protein [Rugamonas aquatica]|uniref:Uncharacterized protein n=1 Tax=Rugamonas aquatica TaxID=2743357 RepID=A0A6A7N679_9BURK|nr:hypothetical protein [Rugamonas aquatica]MQA40604.1 hypothetical protein [Rugamonas aquatica]